MRLSPVYRFLAKTVQAARAKVMVPLREDSDGRTQIEWTDATCNPVAGCSIISAGCTNCYAMEMAKRQQVMRIEKYKPACYEAKSLLAE